MKKSNLGALVPLTAMLVASAAHAEPQQQNDAKATSLDVIKVEAESDITLEQDGYVAISGRDATKVKTPIIEIPQAISTVTQDQIEDQRPRTLNESMSYAAAVNPNNYGFDTRFDAFTIRGFPAFYNGVFRDGLRQYNSPTALYKNEPYGLEGIAIMKGPASSLYGVSGPGGIINLVTKRPKDEPFHEVEVQTGSHARKQVAADFADSYGAFNYRLTGLFRDSDTALSGYKDNKLYIAPAFSWAIGDNTTFTFLSEYSRSLTGGTASFYNPSFGVASRIYAGDPDFNDFVHTQGRVGYEFEHRFDNDITLRQHLRYSKVDAKLQYSGLYKRGNGLGRYWGRWNENMSALTVDTMIEIPFSTGNIDHELLAGFDYTTAEYDAESTLGYVSAAATDAAPLGREAGQRQKQMGAYIHDQMTWNNLTAFASLRYDNVRTDSTDKLGRKSNQTDRGWSGRLGVSYRTSAGFVPYANFSTSFAPNIGVVYDNLVTLSSRPAKPTKSRQYEVGIKYEIPGTTSLIGANFYDIYQTDGIVFEVDAGGRNRQRQLDIHARGVELEAVGQFAHGWSVIGSLAYQKLVIKKGSTGTKGKELSGTPNLMGSLWVSKSWESGSSIGAGLRYVGKSFGDDRNIIRNKQRVFLDMEARYAVEQVEGLELQVNVKNLLNSKGQTCTSGNCYFDEGRSFTANLRYRF